MLTVRVSRPSPTGTAVASQQARNCSARNSAWSEVTPGSTTTNSSLRTWQGCRHYEPGCQGCGDGAQQAVADGVSVHVVDALEIVDVEHDDAHLSVGPGLLNERVKFLDQVSAVVQPGEGILGGLFRQVTSESVDESDLLDQSSIGRGELC